MSSLNCQGKLLNLTNPVVMGILNATPDSFYDGGKYQNVENAIKRTEEMLHQGATIIDVGGMSSRPGAEIIEVDEEIRRVLPVIIAIRKEFPDLFLSIDTFRAFVGRAAFENGIDIINDISAGELDPAIIDFAGKEKTPYFLMHMKGIPVNMQDDPNYEDVVSQVLQYLASRIKLCEEKGIQDLVIDPGFGFGKSLSHNYDILKKLEVFQILEKPVLVGISRKSMISKAIARSTDEAIFGTTAAHMVALQKGAKILRVHDVQAASDTLKVWEQLTDK